MNMNVESTGTAAGIVQAVSTEEAPEVAGQSIDSMIAELLHAAPPPAAAPQDTWEPQVVAADDLKFFNPHRSKMVSAVLLKRISDGRKILLPASGLLGATKEVRDERLNLIRTGGIPIPALWVTNADKGLRAVEMAEHERRTANLEREAKEAQRREDRRKRRAAEEVVKQMGAAKKVVVAVVKELTHFGAILQVTPEVDGLLHHSQIVGGIRTLQEMQVGDEVEVVVLPCEETKGPSGHPRLRVTLSHRLVPFAHMLPGDAMSARVVSNNGTEFAISVEGEHAVLPHDKLGIIEPDSIAREKNTRVKFVGIEPRTYLGKDEKPVTKYVAVFSK